MDARNLFRCVVFCMGARRGNASADGRADRRLHGRRYLNAVDTRQLARRLRGHALRMTHRAGASHIGSCLSMADILAVLYGAVLRVDSSRPDWPARDRLVVSNIWVYLAYALLLVLVVVSVRSDDRAPELLRTA